MLIFVNWLHKERFNLIINVINYNIMLYNLLK